MKHRLQAVCVNLIYPNVDSMLESFHLVIEFEWNSSISSHILAGLNERIETSSIHAWFFGRINDACKFLVLHWLICSLLGGLLYNFTWEKSF